MLLFMKPWGGIMWCCMGGNPFELLLQHQRRYEHEFLLVLDLFTGGKRKLSTHLSAPMLPNDVVEFN